MDYPSSNNENCFSYKWDRQETYDSEAMRKKTYQWLVERYFGTEKKRSGFLKQNRGKKILDAGCGSGFSSSLLFGKALNQMKYLGVDNSDSVLTARERFNGLGLIGNFIKKSITTMRLSNKFDIIFCEGVLHHTSDPFRSFKNLVSHLKSYGQIMFYVYRKKAPIREYSDDFIRGKLKGLSNEESWNKLISLTKLGKTLGDLNIEVPINDNIELLGIPKGKYNLQRLLYWFFIKMFYDKNLSIDEMNHINFDWYKPLKCHRFEIEEVESWIHRLKLKKIRFVTEESGITVVAQKS